MLQTLIQKRSNGYYYFRWVYPIALRKLLGKRELIKSLRTTSKFQALARTGRYYMLVEKYKAQLLQLGRVVGANTVRDEYPSGVSNCLADIISGRISVEEMDNAFYREYLSWFYSYFVEGVSCYQAKDYSEMISHRDMFASFLVDFQQAATNQKGEIAGGVSLKDILLNFIESVDDLGSEYLPLAPFADMLRQTDSLELIDRLSNDLVLIFHKCLTILNDKLDSSKIKASLPSFVNPKISPSILDVQSSTLELQSILFSELYSQFIVFKKTEVNLTEKMQGDYDDYVKTFLCGIGDKPINTITKKQIREFLVTYERLPRRNLKAYKDRPITELWNLPVPEKDRIATRTMTSAKKFLSGVFRFAVDEEYLTVSPANDLGMKIQLEKKRGHFLDSEVRKIFEVLDNDDHVRENVWQKWAVLFGAYTGARAGEVMELHKEDIRRDEESGIHSVIVRGTKTKNALREFPIPPELLSKGFLDFTGGGSGRVFPANKGNKAITAFFPRIMEKSGVPKLNTKNLTRSFHSFRHTVVTKTRAANFDEALVQQIVGHEKTGAGITDTYTHDFTAVQLLPVVGAIKY